MRFRSAGALIVAWLGAACIQAGAVGAEQALAPLAEPVFESVAADRIPRAVVASMVQDRNGLLWIGTGDGLVRFDGYRLQPQERSSGEPAARSLGWIRAMLAGRDGRVWIGSEASGLVVHDPRSERIEPVALGGTPGAPAPTVRALAEDPDGALWIGTLGNGLLRLDTATGAVSHHRPGPLPGSLLDARVLAVLADRQGTLWVGTWQGLSRRRAGSDRFEPVFASGNGSLAGRIVQRLLEAPDGRLWAGTLQGDLAVIDPATGAGRMVGQAGGGAVNDLALSSTGQVWVGRTTGLDLHDAQYAHFLQRLQHDPRRPAGLAANEVTCLLVDRAGAVWVGGLGLGLQRHTPNNLALWVRGAEARPGSPFADGNARGLLARDDGGLWVANQTGGVAALDAQLQVQGVAWPPGPPGPPGPAAAAAAAAAGARHAPPVDAMAQLPDGSTWLATNGWLHQIDRARRPLRALRHGAGFVHRLVATRDGTLWVCTHDGLYRLGAAATTLQRLPWHDGRPLVGDVFTVAENADGSLWVGSASGLLRLRAGAPGLDPVAAESGAGLGSAVVIGLLVDRRQGLWLDTAVTGLHRLLRWDGERAAFDRISVRLGRAGRPFGVNLLEDMLGRIWTQQYVYDPASDRLDELTATDGKHFGTGWFGAYAALPDGRLLFGGSRGLLVVQPERFAPSAYAPPVVVSGLRINGQPKPAGALAQGLQMTPGERSFSVEFAALDYAGPDRVHYAYQLEGFDPDWISTGAEQRSASYSNLDPGDYRLRVRATNRSGLWSPHELAIPVRVLPGWWQQRWLQAAAALLLLAAVVALVQGRTRRLRLAQRALEAKVQARTADLERLTQALQAESAALEASSLTDPLTGLHNRRFLARHIGADVERAQRRHETDRRQGAAPHADADLVFFLIDLDNFKQVNDQYGHAAGDAVLTQMRGRLQQVFRETDHLVRWGGEEFLIVARDSNRAHAAALAERALQAVSAQPFVLDDGRPLVRTCSLGFACLPLSPAHPRALDWSETVSLADAALYAAKAAGRNRWVGVRDAGTLDEAALRAHPAPEPWLAGGTLTVQRSA